MSTTCSVYKFLLDRSFTWSLRLVNSGTVYITGCSHASVTFWLHPDTQHALWLKYTPFAITVGWEDNLIICPFCIYRAQVPDVMPVLELDTLAVVSLAYLMLYFCTFFCHLLVLYRQPKNFALPENYLCPNLSLCSVDARTFLLDLNCCCENKACIVLIPALLLTICSYWTHLVLFYSK